MKRALTLIVRMFMTVLVAAGLIGAAAAQTVPAPGQSPTVDAIKKDGKLRAGVAIAWPWLGQDPKTGNYIGAAADLGQKIADTLGVPLEYVPSGWDVIIAGLQAKQFELALAPLFATPKRMAVIDFANYARGGHLLQRDENQHQGEVARGP
jgi:polar amino acid transport system substrate-binding protein